MAVRLGHLLAGSFQVFFHHISVEGGFAYDEELHHCAIHTCPWLDYLNLIN